MASDFNTLIRGVVGTAIVQVQYFVHMSRDNNATVIYVKIKFEDDKFMTVQCASDGESLRIEKDLFEAADLGEAGRLDVIDANDRDPASLVGCIGKVANCMTVETCRQMPKSLRIDCNGHKIFFSNVGDVLNFDEARYRKMISEEEWPPLTATSFPSE